MIRTHVFRGNRYRMLTKKPRGWDAVCSNPRLGDRRMYVPMESDTQYALYLALHESLHACLYELDEPTVHDMAEDISRFLWRLGWRKQ